MHNMNYFCVLFPFQQLPLSRSRLFLFLTQVIAVFLISANPLTAQTITGTFPPYANQEVRLEGFRGFKTYLIGKTLVDSSGNFSIPYTEKDQGVGVLLVESEQKPLVVILSGESVSLEGTIFPETDKMRVLAGRENQYFDQYAREQPKREQAISAWKYLEKLYTQDPYFAGQKKSIQNIQNEMEEVEKQDQAFLQSLPQDAFCRWYLPARKLISNVSLVAQYRTDQIPATLAGLRNLDLTDPRLYTSGLYKEAIENHFWLIENSGKTLDGVFAEMNRSIDLLMEPLLQDEQKLNEVTDFLFDLLETRSLFQSSEYLALKMLNQNSCTLNSDLAKQLETYRAMKKGNKAPDLVFTTGLTLPGSYETNPPQKLSDIQSPYTLLVFGASWCPKCTEEIPAIAQLYAKWKALGVEVVFISLDETESAFKAFAQKFPFLSVCDFQKWKSPLAQACYVFSTPTQYLLNANREIILRPASVKQTDAWVDWFLGGANK